MKTFGGEWPLAESVPGIVERARRAWDEQRPSFVYRQVATSGLSQDGLNDVIDALLRMGWRIGGTALTFNTVGMRMEVGLYTFVRPEFAR
jgi:hypothetical protein